MRGMKASYYDGGHRVPFFARCPALGLEDRDVNMLISHIDLLPTFIELFELEMPRESKFDGINVSDCLTGVAEELAPRPVFMAVLSELCGARKVGLRSTDGSVAIDPGH